MNNEKFSDQKDLLRNKRPQNIREQKRDCPIYLQDIQLTTNYS